MRDVSPRRGRPFTSPPTAGTLLLALVRPVPIGIVQPLDTRRPLGLGTHARNRGIAVDTVTDAQGNAYRTVQVGNQVWMAENLRTDVVDIPHRLPADVQALTPLGRLYQLYDPATMDLRDVSTILVPGWHLPSNEDWDICFDVLRREPQLVASFAPAYAGAVDWHDVASGLNQEAWYWSSTMSGADYDYTNQYYFKRMTGGGVELSSNLNRAYASVRFIKADVGQHASAT